MDDRVFKKLNVICLIVYLVVFTSIMYLTSSTANVGTMRYLDKIISSINLMPFKDMGNIKHVCTSMIIYIPFAILLPNSFNCMKSRKYFYTSVFLIILCIEIMQVVTLHGYGDINDILFGLLGTTIVYELMMHIKIDGISL